MFPVLWKNKIKAHDQTYPALKRWSQGGWDFILKLPKIKIVTIIEYYVKGHPRSSNIYIYVCVYSWLLRAEK